MSEEDFLSRWSRRKGEAEEAARSPKPFVEVTASLEPSETSPAPVEKPSGLAKSNEEKEFDLSSLPSIDSITAATDISLFLRMGVPLELTRAALRRAWATDPTIRDFVGLAENAWDFNDPNAMPGFGALDQTPEQIQQLVSKIVGEVRREAEGIASTIADDSADLAPRNKVEAAGTGSSASSLPPTAHVIAPPDASDVGRTQDQTTTQDGDVAVQNERSSSRRLVRRTHGGALPR